MHGRTPGHRPAMLSSARSWSAVILGISTGLAPLLAVWTPLGLAPLVTVTAIVIVALDGRAVIHQARRLAPLAFLLLLLAVWSMLSACWSILPLHSFVEGLRLFAVGASGLVLLSAAIALSPEERPSIAAFAAIGTATAAALLLFEAATGGALTQMMYGRGVMLFARFDRSSTTLVLALWPALAAASPSRCILGWALAAAVAAASIALESTAAVLALAISLVAFVGALFSPRLIAAVLGLGLACMAVVLPLATPSDRAVVELHHEAPWIKSSGIHRLLIWRFTADRIAERPLIGWGMDAARALPGGGGDFNDTLPEAEVGKGSTALPLHPHNAVLEWQVELGLPGTFLCLMIAGWSLWQAATTDRLSHIARARALAWVTAALVIGLLSYGAWQAWWLSCLIITAAAVATAAARSSDAVRRI